MVSKSRKEKKEKNGNEKQWLVEARKLAKLPEEEIESRLRTMQLSKPDKVRFLWNAIEEIQAKKSDKKKGEIPAPVVTPQKEEPQIQKTPEKIPEVKDAPIVENDEQRRKEEKQIKLSKVIEMVETQDIEKMDGVTLFTLEKLKENGANRMTPGVIKSYITEKIKDGDATIKLPREKIGDKVTSTYKISDENGTPLRFLGYVPIELISSINHKNRRGKQPEYDLVTLIPENIPEECDPRKNKSLNKILRINGNARDGIKATEKGYVCEIETGFKETVKISEADPSLEVTTSVPYANFFPRSEKIEGPEYILRVVMGPIDSKTLKPGSKVIGPSKGLQLRRGDNVEAVTLYEILEPMEKQPVAQ